jgi:pantetheine-phosphate adenylyltransferase
MKREYVYPGTFAPPTYGHVQIALKAADLFPQITILCSHNTEKGNRWFDEEVCRTMWSSYLLPRNVRIVTFNEFTREARSNSKIVMIRGVRDESDYDHEKEVLFSNHRRFGVDSCCYFVADYEYADISSSAAREMAKLLDLNKLHELVSPRVVSELLKTALGVSNIFLVVGRPGSGKSTFLRMLTGEGGNNHFIETDRWNDSFKDAVARQFGTDNLIELTLQRDAEVSAFLKDAWLRRLAKELRKAPKNSNVFVEAAYGLIPEKSLFRFIGGNVIFFGCDDPSENATRVINRGTRELLPFIERIPGLEESRRIAEEHRLAFTYINTSCSLDELRRRANIFGRTINRKETR